MERLSTDVELRVAEAVKQEGVHIAASHFLNQFFLSLWFRSALNKWHNISDSSSCFFKNIRLNLFNPICHVNVFTGEIW